MAAYRQLPAGQETFLDHVAHWVPDIAAASGELERLGFVLTPFTPHANSPAPGEPMVPAGSANRCIMLREGYIEILTPTGETEIGRELQAGIARYVGLHLAAFATDDPDRERERLGGEGFALRPVVDLRRRIETPEGMATEVGFTVLRPQPGAMAEGRIQYLRHRTPETLWQEHWMRHRNGAVSLRSLALCVADPDEAAARYRRYLNRPAERIPGGWMLDCDRGQIAVLAKKDFEAAVPGVTAPVLPFMAGYALGVADLSATRRFLLEAGERPADLPSGGIAIPLSAELGGTLVFQSNANGRSPWVRP